MTTNFLFLFFKIRFLTNLFSVARDHSPHLRASYPALCRASIISVFWHSGHIRLYVVPVLSVFSDTMDIYCYMSCQYYQCFLAQWTYTAICRASIISVFWHSGHILLYVVPVLSVFSDTMDIYCFMSCQYYQCFFWHSGHINYIDFIRRPTQ